MKKLLTRLAKAVIVAACMYVPISMDAVTVYFDTQGQTYSSMKAYAWKSTDISDDKKTDMEKVGNYIWKVTLPDYMDRVDIYKENYTSGNRLVRDLDIYRGNGKIYSQGNRSGIAYQLLIQADADGVDWSDGKILTWDASNPSVFTGEIEITGNGYFRFAHAPAGDNYSKYSVYAPSADTSVTAENATDLASGNSGNWQIAAGKYDVKVNLLANTFVFTPKKNIYFVKGSTLYFKPDAQFLKHGDDGKATFKALFGNSDSAEVFCTKIGNTGYYSFVVPIEGLEQVCIRRGSYTNTGVSGTWYDNYTQWMTYEEGKDCIEMNAIDNNSKWESLPSSWTVYDGSYTPTYRYTLYNSFNDGVTWNDVDFKEIDGVLKAELTFDPALSSRRGCLVRVYKDDELEGRYSAKTEDSQLSLLTPDSSVSLYATGDGVRNIQVPAGTTGLSLELALDGVTPKDLKYSLEGTRTPDIWIGAGKEGGGERTQINITAGEYDVYELVAGSGDSFRFYNAASGGDWIGPSEAADKTIPGNGETLHTTAGNSYVYKFDTAGTYHIRVISFDGINTAVFKVIKEETVTAVPGSMTMQIWKNTQAVNDPACSVEMKYDEATSRFTGIIPGEMYGGDHWSVIRLTSRNEDGCYTASYGTDGNNLYLTDGNSKHDLKAYSGNTVLGNTVCNFYSSSHAYDQWEGDVTVIADFSTTVPTISAYPCYYFIGDQNKWFSKEFDGDSNRGINAEVCDNTKAGWEFLPEFDEAGEPTGWFVRRSSRLAGQFQIFNGIKWDSGHTYSHSVDINNEQEKFETYLESPMKIGGENTIRQSQGQNFNLPCNAVEDCEIRFNPDQNKLVITGTMVDYYIFYGRQGDLNRGENSPLRAHINSDKPNRNNYYLPFNKVTDDQGAISLDAKNVKLENGDFDYDHMNYTDGEDWNANGKVMGLLEFDANGKYTKGDAAFEELFPYADDVKAAYSKGKLPNGMSLKNRKIWYAKVPNGFANPAGTHFAVAFRNSDDAASYRDENKEYPLWTPLGTRHLYFFDGIHMHVNNISWSEKWDTEIAYRIYTYDINYNNVVVDYVTPVTDNSGNLYTLHHKAQRGARPENTTDDDQDGWIELTNEHKNCGLWHSDSGSECGCPLVNSTVMHDWRVADTEPEVTASVKRSEIPAGLASARVQFRVRIAPKGRMRAAGNGSFEPYTVYLPAAPTIGQGEDEIKLQGVDHYMVMDNDNGIWTGIENLFDDYDFEGADDATDTDAVPVYYNLQGVRVDNPGKGIYIRVRGDKSDKVVF